MIVGGGFAGLACAQELRRSDCDVVLVDKENHHLFQPLLYQVATAGLSPADIAWPIRGLLSRQAKTKVVMAEVTGVDTKAKTALLEHGSIPYDQLVLATGVVPGFFGHEEWAENAQGLKCLADATALRGKVLSAFEMAETEPDPAVRRALLTLVIVGGGPTGVEMAGSLAELSRRTLAKDFRNIDPREARIVMVEGRRVLAEFPEALGEKAVRSLEGLGVEVRFGEFVESIDEDRVVLPSGTIETKTVVWAAGMVGTPAGQWLEANTDRIGRILVDDHCRVPGCDDVYAIGDVAVFASSDGNQLPGTCPVAIQQGKYLGKCLSGKQSGPFQYFDKGILATIGRKLAVGVFFGRQVSGFPAWFIWMSIHLWSLLTAQSKVLVFVQWMWSYLWFSRGARLIVRSQRQAERNS